VGFLLYFGLCFFWGDRWAAAQSDGND